MGNTNTSNSNSNNTITTTNNVITKVVLDEAKEKGRLHQSLHNIIDQTNVTIPIKLDTIQLETTTKQVTSMITQCISDLKRITLSNQTDTWLNQTSDAIKLYEEELQKLTTECEACDTSRLKEINDDFEHLTHSSETLGHSLASTITNLKDTYSLLETMGSTDAMNTTTIQPMSCQDVYKEQELLMQSFEETTQHFQSSFESLAQAISSSNFLSDLMSIGTELYLTLDQISQKISSISTELSSPLQEVDLTSAFSPPDFSEQFSFNTEIIDIIDKINDYNQALSKSKKTQKKFLNSLSNQSPILSTYFTSIQGAKATFGGYIKNLVSAKLSTIALSVATTAMTTVLTAGISVAIGFLITKISNYIHAQERAREKSAELSKAYNDERTSLDSQIEKYQELQQALDNGNISVEEFKTKKESLIELQNDLVNTYGNEIDNIDLVNGKYEEQLGILQHLSKEKAKEYLANNYNHIKEQKKYLSEKTDVDITSGKSLILSSELENYLKNKQNISVSDEGDRRYLELKNMSREKAYETLVNLWNDIDTNFGNSKDAEDLKSAISKTLNDDFDKDKIEQAKFDINEEKQAKFNSNDTIKALYHQVEQTVTEFNDAISSGVGVEQAEKNLATVKEKVAANAFTIRDFYSEFYNLFNSLGQDNEGIDTLDNAFANNSSVKNYAKLLQGLSANDLKAIDFDNETLEAGEKAFTSLIEYLGVSKENAQSVIDKLVELNYISQSTSSDSWRPSQEQTDAINTFQVNISTLGDALFKLKNDESVDPNSFTDLYQMFPSLLDGTDDLQTSIESLSDTLLNDLFTTLGDNVPDELKQSLSALAKESMNAKGKIISLTTASSELKTKFSLVSQTKTNIKELGKISEDTLSSIQSAFPELETSIELYRAGLISAPELFDKLQNCYKTDETNYLRLVRSKIANDETFFSDKLGSDVELQERLKSMYELDLKNYKSVNQSKLLMDAEFINKMKTNWGGYFSAVYNKKKGIYELKDNRPLYTMNSLERLDYDNWRLEAQEYINNHNENIQSLNDMLPELDSADYLLTGLKGGSGNSGGNGGSGGNGDNEPKKESYDLTNTILSTVEKELQNLLTRAENADTQKEKLQLLTDAKTFISDNEKYFKNAIENLDNQLNSIGLSKESRNIIDQAYTASKDEVDNSKKATPKKKKSKQNKSKSTKDNTNQNKQTKSKQTKDKTKQNSSKSSDDKNKQTKSTKNKSKQTKIKLDSKKNSEDNVKKYIDGTEQKIDLQERQVEFQNTSKQLDTQELDTILTEYDKKIKLKETIVNGLENDIKRRKELGETLTKEDYASLIVAQKELKDLAHNEYEELTASFNDCNFPEDSTNYIEYSNQIQTLGEYINECDDSLKQFSTDSELIKFENFENSIETFSKLKDELSGCLKLLNKDNFIDDNGKFTKEGISGISLYGMQIEIDEKSIRKYNELINDLKELYKSNAITEKTYDHYLEKYTGAQKKLVNEVKSASNAIINLKVSALNAETEAFRKEIDKQKEYINKQKEIHDLQRQEKETKESLSKKQAKINLLRLRGGEKEKALALRLESDLAKEKETLEEQQYQKNVSSQLEALDQAGTDFKNAQNEKIELLQNSSEEQKQVIDNMLKDIQFNYSGVLDTLTSTFEQYGLTLSDSLTNPWKVAISAVNEYKKSCEEISDIPIPTSEKTATQHAAGITSNVALGLLEHKDRIVEILQHGNGKGSGKSDLNRYVIDTFGKQLSYEQMAEIANLLGFSEVTKKNIKNNTSMKNLILSIIKNAHFKNGGEIVSDHTSIGSHIQSNGDNTIISARVGESVLTKYDTEVIKRFTRITPHLDSMMRNISMPAMNEKRTAPTVTLSIGNLLSVDTMNDVNRDQLIHIIRDEGIPIISKELAKAYN